MSTIVIQFQILHDIVAKLRLKGRARIGTIFEQQTHLFRLIHLTRKCKGIRQNWSRGLGGFKQSFRYVQSKSLRQGRGQILRNVHVLHCGKLTQNAKDEVASISRRNFNRTK